MGLLARLLAGRKAQTRQTTIDNPLRIPNPRLGFLNLQDETGAEKLSTDRRVLLSLFSESEISNAAPPKCDVLFIYCTLDNDGRIAGSETKVRDLITSAGAYIAVIASENASEAYKNALTPKTGWSANVAMVLTRRGDKLAEFFRTIFERMFRGQSMLVAWVEIAPQAPGSQAPDAPGVFMAAEAGHVTFAR
jgi:hypothetical protein